MVFAHPLYAYKTVFLFRRRATAPTQSLKQLHCNWKVMLVVSPLSRTRIEGKSYYTRITPKNKKTPCFRAFSLAFWYPVGESNPCYRRERAVS